MALRFLRPRNARSALVLAAVIAAVPVAALAKEAGTPPAKQQKKLPEAPGKLPKVGADRTRGLDFLFGALKAAPD
jgi:hypothetical protein